MSKLTVFNHIPKTAGSTIRGILALNYSGNIFEFSGDINQYSEFINSPEQRSDKYTLIHGHVPFGIHNNLTYSPDTICFTYLRDPISRLISEYVFSIKPHQGLHNLVLGKKLSIHSFINADKPWLNNPYIKFLSGNHPGNVIECSHDDLLAQSKKYIDDEFLLFGITEFFDESILLLAKKLGWKPPVYIMKNVASHKLGGTDVLNLLPDSLVNLLEKRLESDYVLYNYAISVLKHEISNQPPSYWSALEELREIKERLHVHYNNKKHSIYSIENGVDNEVTAALTDCNKINAYLHSG